MPGRPEIVRLLALAAFIIVVAVATWLAELSRTLVGVVIAAALAVAWAIEGLARRGPRLRLSQELAEEGDDEEAFMEEPGEPSPVAEPARSERSWFLIKKAPTKQEPLETAPKPPLVRVAPVVEGRARVMRADAASAEAVGEAESAEPAIPEGPQPNRPEDTPAPEAARRPLRPVPPSPPPEPEPEPAPGEEAPVVNLAARPRGPRTWNLWELERLAREEFEGEALEQSQFLLIHLRPFARADGQLPLEFDELVRDSFGRLLERLPHA